MKIPNKRELQQTAFNHSSDIVFQDFMNPKQMLQRLTIALAQVKVTYLKIYLMKSDKSYILCIEQKKSLKKCITI